MKMFNLFRHCVVVSLGVAMLVAPVSESFAQAAPGVLEIYTYRGADREQRLLEGARREGTVVIYTAMNLKDSLPTS